MNSAVPSTTPRPTSDWRWWVSLPLALALACSMTLRLAPDALRYSSLRWLVMGGLALLLVLPVRWLVARVLVPGLRPYSSKGRSAWLVGSVAGALLLCLTIPVKPFRPGEIHLELTALGEKNPSSQGSEVWVHGLLSSADGQPVSLEAEQSAGQWKTREGSLEGSLLSEGKPPATLRWVGYLDEDAQLVLTQHDWSGHVRVTLNGETQRVDLYSASPGQWVLPVRPARAPAFTEAWLLRRLSRLSELLCIALLLLLAGVGLSAWPGSAREAREAESSRWSWLAPAAVCAAVWSVFLLAFWPGLLSVDSLSQWEQMSTGRLSNGHPALHTMMIWLVTRFWHSPAAVALCQVLALALAFGLALRELGRWGVPAWARWVVTVLFALSPANTALSITLWKDIAYSITLLALSTVLLRLARTRGEALRSKAFLGGLTGLLALAMLLRHNGIPVAVLLMGLLAIIVPRGLRRRVGVVVLGSLGAFVLVMGPLYRALGVAPMPRAFAYSQVFHLIGAMVHAAPDSLAKEDRELLESMQPMKIWRDDYYKFCVNSLIYSGQLQWSVFDESPEPGRALVRLWLKLMPDHVPTLIEHQLGASSLVWRIQQAPQAYTYLYQFDVPANEMGLKRDSRWPAAERALTRWLDATAQPKVMAWFWRPALLLYLSLFCALIAAVRLRQGWVVLGILPAVLNSAVLMGLSLAQDFRYQYPMHVAGLVSLLLVFVRREALAVEVPVAAPDDPAPVAAGSPPKLAV
jgi:hypothetical protein